MIKNIKNNVVYYTFKSFLNTNLVNHCFSSKIGGISKGVTATMNFAFKKGDSDETVLKNYKILSETLNFTYKNISLAKQIHKENIKIVKKEDVGLLKNNNLKDTDGIITKEKNIPLATLYADCVPLYFLDPVKKVIALSHAGWRGTLNKIGEKTIKKMKNFYKCNEKDILVGIGPSIGKCCFEVDENIKNEFEDKLYFSTKFIERSNKNKYKIDLWKINKQILKNTGILENNIEIANICTKCNFDIFYSHRVMGLNRGCMVAILELI